MSKRDELAAQVEAARDRYFRSLALEDLDEWRRRAERLYVLEGGMGISPIWRGPYPREAIRPRVRA